MNKKEKWKIGEKQALYSDGGACFISETLLEVDGNIKKNQEK